MLGYRMVMKGKRNRLLVLHDWLSDTTSYDFWIYLYGKESEICLLDLRGYGISKALTGSFNLSEIIQDMEEVIKILGWNDFYILGHSMTALAAELFASKHPRQCKGVVSACPIPPCGAEIPADVLKGLTAIAQHPEERARSIVMSLTGNRYQESFIDYKVKRWKETSIPEARTAYLKMFAHESISDEVRGSEIPILVIAGQYDAKLHQYENLKSIYLPLYPNAKVVEVPSGHYPMQETPAIYGEWIDRFIQEQK